jgi:hypothetical protein
MNKPRSFKKDEYQQMAITSLMHGGRAAEDQLSEIASMSVVDLLSQGLTLEQAETIFKMAAIETARLAEERRMLPKVPATELKIKTKGKK